MASYYDPYYYPNYQHRTEISYFTGEDVDGWLSQIENLFYRHQTMSNQKLAVGTFYLAGGALEWYREWYWDMRRSWRTLTWENFVADLRCRFWSESLTRRSVVIESMSKTCEGMIQLLNEMKNQNSVYMSDFSKLKSQLSSISTCGSSANKVEESDLNCELSAADVVSTDCEKFESASVAISKDLDNPKSDEMNSVAVPPRLNWELHKQVSFNTTYGICPQVLNLFNDTLGQPQGDRKCEMLLGDLNGIEHSYSPTVCENDTLVHSRPLRNHFPLALVWNEAGVYDQKETQGFAYLFCALNSHSSSCSPSVCLNVDMDWFSYYAMRTNAIGNQSYILSQKKKVRCDKPPAKPPDDIVIYAATEANIETIWNKVELEDPVENIGAKLVRQAAAKTNDLAGDGTTTVVLAQGLITEGVKVVVAGANPVLITRSIEKTTKALVQELKAISKEVEDSELTDVAAVSAGSNYEVGNMIAEAMSKVGRKGVVTLEEGNSAENTLYVVEGMQFDRGYISPYFVTDSKKMTVEYENCKLLLVDKITNARDLINVLEEAIKGGYPIVIVAEDIEQEALATFVVNKLRGALKIAAFKAHGYMDFGFCDKGVAQLFGYVFVTNDISSSSNVEFPWIEATLNKWEILFLRIIEDSDVLEFEAEVSAISMEKFMETSPLWDLSIQAIYFIWTAAMTYLTTIMVGMLGEDDLGLLLFTFDHSGVLFLSHENHLLLDSRVGYSALSCVSLVAASLSLSWPIYMSIESEELISPEDRCIQVLSVDIGGPALGLRLEIGRKQKNAEKEVIEGASFCSSFFPTVKHLSVKRHRELRAIIFVTVETHFDLFDTDKKEYELFDIVDMRDDPKSFGKLDYTMQTMEGLLEEAVAVSAISVRISKFLIFSSPRPPEDADLEDKVNLKERGMLRVQISQSLGSLMQYVEGYK